MVLVRNFQKHLAAFHLKGLHFFLWFGSQSPCFIGIQKYGYDKRAHQLQLWSKRYIVISSNWLRFCKCCSSLGNPWENLRFEPWSETTACYSTQLLPFYHDLPLDATGAVFFISLVFTALKSILYLVHVLLRLSTRASCSCSSSVTQGSIWLSEIRRCIVQTFWFQGEV